MLSAQQSPLSQSIAAKPATLTELKVEKAGWATNSDIPRKFSSFSSDSDKITSPPSLLLCDRNSPLVPSMI
jgi:hypothetical protein